MKTFFRNTLALLTIALLMAACATTKQPLQPQKPVHTTAQTKRATLKVESAGNKLSVGCQLQTVFDSVCVVSIQPISGMEMYAMHATPSQILVIDRMHKRYALTDYATINAILTPKIDFRQLQNMVSGIELPQGILTLTKHFAAGKHEADLSLTFPEIRYDQPLTVRPQNISKYSKTDLKTLLKSLL